MVHSQKKKAIIKIYKKCIYNIYMHTHTHTHTHTRFSRNITTEIGIIKKKHKKQKKKKKKQ